MKHDEDGNVWIFRCKEPWIEKPPLWTSAVAFLSISVFAYCVLSVLVTFVSRLGS